MSVEGAEIVARCHKAEVDAAIELMNMAIKSASHYDYGHAKELLKSSVEHLGSAEVIQRVEKSFPRERDER